MPGVDEVIDEKNATQITEDEEIQDTGNKIKPENGPTHAIKTSALSQEFPCYYCEQRFPSQSELAHMDKESADAKEKQQT
jgi:hypothetical protein